MVPNALAVLRANTKTTRAGDWDGNAPSMTDPRRAERQWRALAVAMQMMVLVGGQEEANEHLEEGFQDVIAPSWSKEAEELEGLDPPETDQAMVARMIGILSDASHDLEEGDDPKKVLAARLPQFQREANAFGFNVCSRPI